MPKITIWKFLLIGCIAGFAAAGASIGHFEKAVIIEQANTAAVAPQIALPMCPSAQGGTNQPIGAIYNRYLDQTPMSHVAAR